MRPRNLLFAAALLLAAACQPVVDQTVPPSSTGAQSPPVSAAGPTQASATVGRVLSTFAFDTCRAPTTAQMNAWKASPYRVVGVYIGGRSAACPPGINNPNFNSAWVNTVVRDQHWRAMPIWVGLQAPCSGYSHRISYDGWTAGIQGYLEADDAAAAAQSFGFGPAIAGELGSPIFFDLEHYARGGACSEAVKHFMNGWTVRLHELGYQSGFYSSGSSGVTDMVHVAQSGGPLLPPDDLWYAHWNGSATVYGSPYVPDSLWIRRRHHQYRGGHIETYGGVSINIDSNASDGLVAEWPRGRDGTYWPEPVGPGEQRRPEPWYEDG